MDDGQKEWMRKAECRMFESSMTSDERSVLDVKLLRGESGFGSGNSLAHVFFFARGLGESAIGL